MHSRFEQFFLLKAWTWIALGGAWWNTQLHPKQRGKHSMFPQQMPNKHSLVSYRCARKKLQMPSSQLCPKEYSAYTSNTTERQIFLRHFLHSEEDILDAKARLPNNEARMQNCWAQSSAKWRNPKEWMLIPLPFHRLLQALLRRDSKLKR